MRSFIDGDSAAGLRSVVKQQQTENYGVCEQLAGLGTALLAEAPRETRVVVCFGSGRAAEHSWHRAATEGCTSLCAGGGVSSVITHCAEHSLGPFPHLLPYARVRTWVISWNIGSCWHIKRSSLMFWQMLDGLRLPLWSGRAVLHPCF